MAKGGPGLIIQKRISWTDPKIEEEMRSAVRASHSQLLIERRLRNNLENYCLGAVRRKSQ